MNPTTKELIQEAAKGSNEGKLHFGQVIQLLMQAGVESYFADYRKQETTYYLPNDKTVSLSLEIPNVASTEAFDAEAIKAAIRSAQQDKIKYPEFKKLSKQAGCIGYIVWITGRHVTYFGQKGEMHIEQFPS